MAMGPFWSLHNHVLGDRYPPSVAVVNCVGNLGGFLGPWLLGLLRDLLGGSLRCPDGTDSCSERYGWGLVVVACYSLACHALSAAAAIRLGVAYCEPARVEPASKT